jgi:hypothetical protein
MTGQLLRRFVFRPPAMWHIHAPLPSKRRKIEAE